jgi:potassium efflux system protein
MKILSILVASLLLSSGIETRAQTNTVPTADQLQKLGASLKDDVELAPARLQPLLSQIDQATEHLRVAAQFDQAAEKMRQDLSQADSTIEAIHKELEKPKPPPVLASPDTATLNSLENELLQTVAEGDAAQRRVEELDAENEARTARQTELPEMLATASARRSELQQIAALPAKAEDTSPEETTLQQWAVAAELQALEAEITLHELELNNHDTLRELQSARIDQTTRQHDIAEAQAAALRVAVDRQRRIDSEAEAALADQAKQAAALHHPVIQAIAAHNAELAALRVGEDGLSARQKTAAADLQAAKKLTLSTDQRFEELQERLAAIGLTHAVAQRLSRARNNLPDLAPYGPRIRARKQEMAQVQLALIVFGEQREELRDISAGVKRHMEAIGQTADDQQLASLLKEYLTTQRDQLDTLISEYNNYFNELVDLGTAERRLIERVDLLADAISEHILWVRSDFPLGIQSLGSFAQGFSTITAKSNMQALAQSLRTDYALHPFMLLLLLLVELALIGAAFGIRRRWRTIDSLTAKIRSDRFTYTLETLFYTVVRALPLPLPLFYLAWRIGAANAPPLASSVGTACYLTGLVTFCCALVFQSLSPSGLVEVHFKGNPEVLKWLRHKIARLMAMALPLFWFTALAHGLPQAAELNPLARLCFIGLQLMIARFAYTLFCRRSKSIEFLKQNHPENLLLRMRVIAITGFVGIPIIIIIATAIGYYYSAIQMAGWFAETLGLVFLISLAEALLMRGIQVVARRAEFKRRVRERQELQQQREVAGEAEPPAEPIPNENDAINYTTLGESTRKLLTIFVGFILLFGMWLIWSDAVPALRLFDSIVLWNVQAAAGAGEVATTVAISLSDLIGSIIVILLMVAAARHLPSLIELVLLRQLPIAYGERYAISLIIRYVVIAVGVSMAFSMLGIGWSKFKWLAAALSVGLGFGLQEIFANFISGLILLFERPIRVRDYVTVNGTSGEVSRIQIRATTITDWDNKELLIPNKQFVTGELINWTLTSSILRVVISVGIAYGSDTKKAEEVLLRVANAYRLTIPDPEPTAFFTDFGDNSLNFDLRVFIANAEQFRLAKHELNMAVDAAFREAGIVIAFPQLDVHLPPDAAATPIAAPENPTHK